MLDQMRQAEGGERQGTFASPRVAMAVGGATGLLLAIVVAAPWVGRGQVLLLDWVSGPYPGPIGPLLGSDGSTLGAAPLLLLLRGLHRLVGPSLVSWLPLVAWMPVAGGGIGLLARRGGWPAVTAAAALGCCNPFTFDRLAVGQIGVLWAYALLPVAVVAAVADPGRRLVWSARMAAVGAAMTACSPHFFAYWLVVLTVSVALLPMVRRRALAALLATAGALCASSYLFVVRQPALSVTEADLTAFRTRAEPPGLAVTIMTLRGFWRPSELQMPRSAGWWALLVLIGCGVALGFAAAWRRREAMVLVVIGLLGGVLAAGDQGPLGWAYRLAFEHVGPFRILREPQKATALLALCLAVLFGLGASRLTSLIPWRSARTIGTAVLAAIPLAASPALVSFGTKVAAQRPSAAWREADRMVGPGPAGVLALPWHLYVRYPTTPGPVANLAPSRLRAPVASGDNVELPGLETTSSRQRSRHLEDLFRRGRELTDLGARIEPAGLGWVLLVKTSDWTSYQWLEQQKDLVRVLDTPELALYQSTAPTNLSSSSVSRRGAAGWFVRATERAVPIPEVLEGRWTVRHGQLQNNAAGAPTILAADTTASSKNVRAGVIGLSVSGATFVLLLIVAGSRKRSHPAHGGETVLRRGLGASNEAGVHLEGS
jgi:hypothetical protein